MPARLIYLIHQAHLPPPPGLRITENTRPVHKPQEKSPYRLIVLMELNAVYPLPITGAMPILVPSMYKRIKVFIWQALVLPIVIPATHYSRQLWMEILPLRLRRLSKRIFSLIVFQLIAPIRTICLAKPMSGLIQINNVNFIIFWWTAFPKKQPFNQFKI